MVRPRVARGFVNLADAVSHQCIRPLSGSCRAAPGRAQSARETTLLLGYAGLGQLGGWLVGPALGYRPFSFHIAGTVVGCGVPPSVGELWTWAIYNFVVFAVVPYLWFRRRYSAMQLNLRSTNRTNDLLVIVVVAVIESLVELGAFPGIFQLSARQLLIAAPLAFGVFMIGTVLPTMVLIYAILVPRYLKLTGSSATTVILGGVTYAAMHIVEGWSVFTTPRDIALSLIFVVLQYFGPGMMKTVITLRTGNAWVHAIAYHAIPPHVVVDTPLVVKVFGLRRAAVEGVGRVCFLPQSGLVQGPLSDFARMRSSNNAGCCDARVRK